MWLRADTHSRGERGRGARLLLCSLWPGTVAPAALAGLPLTPVEPLTPIPVSYLCLFMPPPWPPGCCVYLQISIQFWAHTRRLNKYLLVMDGKL